MKIIKSVSSRHSMARKLQREHGIKIDPNSLHSFRSRRKFGASKISWSTLDSGDVEYRSFETMEWCTKRPTKLVVEEGGKVVTVVVDWEKL